MKQTIFTLLTLTIMAVLSHAQSVVNSSGKSISNNNLNVEYSIGEIVIKTIQNVQIAATQGLLQPSYQIVSATNEEFDKIFSFKVFPNPMGNQLNIETGYPNFKIVQVFNSTGQMVTEQSFDGSPVLLSSLAPGTYLFCFQSDRFIKTVKIIKK